jgi:hypothetical protein
MNQEHISKQFDADLEGLRTRVLAMGGLVEQQVIRAMEGLNSGDIALIEKVIATDRQVNRHEVELDEACNHVIAKRQPAAGDLRMIMTVVKTITDLERIGDEAKKIAKMARAIHGGDTRAVPRVDLRAPADIAVAMLRKALDAFARLDLSGGRGGAPGPRGGRGIPSHHAPSHHLHDGRPPHHLDLASICCSWPRPSSASATMPRTSPSTWSGFMVKGHASLETFS